MRRGGREMPEMGAGDLESVTEAVETVHITLVSHQSFGRPSVCSVDHAHPLQHHERVHGPTGRSGGTNIDTDSAQFTDEGVANHGLREEQPSGEVPVARAKGGTDSDAILVVLNVTGGVADPVQEKTVHGKETLPAR